jgi:hypothetical protein
VGNEPDGFDALLKAAMEQYLPEPRAGIERRVLHHVRASQRRRRFQILAFAFSLPLLALLVLALFPVSRPPAMVDKTPPKRSQELVAAAGRIAPVKIHRHHVKTAMFPTPSPLTSEEEAFLEFVSRRPQEALDLQARDDEPFTEIPDLQIPPLQSDGGQ